VDSPPAEVTSRWMPNQKAPNPLGGHNWPLQSMRGLAALMVLLGHGMLLLDYRPAPALTSMFLQPNSAVLFFYVLSGYVLGESLKRSTGGLAARSLGFAVKRLTRLLPVHWLAVLLGAGCYRLLWHKPIPRVNPWLGGMFDGWGSVTFENIRANILGLTVSMNGALWSVQVEIFVIPALIALVALSRRIPLRSDAIVLALLSALALVLTDGPLKGTPWGFFGYLNCFYLGILLPKLAERARPLLASGPVTIVAMLGLLMGPLHGRMAISWSVKLLIDSFISAQIIGFVLLSYTPSVRRFLSLRPLVWLGDVSYSFYAYGNAILAVCALVVIASVPPEWLAGGPKAALVIVASITITLLVSLPLAWISYRWVEIPFMNLGRHMAGRLLSVPITGSKELELSTP
jgi:peptidoglycan/LPS O-acetylase OafA/YrhL